MWSALRDGRDRGIRRGWGVGAFYGRRSEQAFYVLGGARVCDLTVGRTVTSFYAWAERVACSTWGAVQVGGST